MQQQLTVYSFGWTFPGFIPEAHFADRVLPSGQGTVNLLSGNTTLHVCEHSRVLGTQNSMYELDPVAAVITMGNNARHLASSITNPYGRELSDDFIPYLARRMDAEPGCVFVIGNCLGAGHLRVACMPRAMRERTIVTAWARPDGEELYHKAGVLDVVSRRRLAARLGSLLPSKNSSVEDDPDSLESVRPVQWSSPFVRARA